MGGWSLAAEVIGLLLVLALVVPLVGLWARRRMLSNRGGVFDCALRVKTSTPGAGWATGMARYEGDVLNWYRTFSLSWWPKVRLNRGDVHVLGHRSPDPVEAVVLFGEDQIVRLKVTEEGAQQVRELAMNPESVTGLLSWLEAAPPRGDYYRRGRL